MTERTDLPALAAGLTTVVAWGSAFVVIRAAGDTLAPGSVALGRLIVSCAVLGVFALVRREALPARRDLGLIALYGVLWLGVYSFTLNAAEQRVDAGTASLLVNTGPILIAVLAGFFLGEGFPRGLYAGLAVAFAGCVLIAVATSHGGSSATFGVILCLVAATAYSVAVVIQKPILGRVSSFQVTWLGGVAALVACLPFAPTLASDLSHGDAGDVAMLVYLGVVPTAIGFATWSFALGRTSAGRMASLTYLIPPAAIALGWIFLDEVPPWLAAVGGALCLGGVALARRRSAPRPVKAAVVPE